MWCETLLNKFCDNKTLKYIMHHIWQRPSMFIQVVRSQGPGATAERLSAIDYFGTGQTNGAHSGPKRQEDEEEDVEEENESESESGDSCARRKRKPKDVESDVKAKKKKKRNIQAEEEGSCFLELRGMCKQTYNTIIMVIFWTERTCNWYM